MTPVPRGRAAGRKRARTAEAVAAVAAATTDPSVLEDPETAADVAELVYETDTVPGITRHRAGRGFVYRAPDGSRVTDERTLRRIRALAVPPAWTHVWISRRPDGHLQATGWDAKGRKQYRYHPRWRAVRDLAKFERLAHFGHALPDLRNRVRADLGRSDLPEEKVVAGVVELLDTTLIRVGNEEYARSNESFGLTTLRAQHAEVAGNSVRLQFRAKGGRPREQVVTDRRLARLVRRCQELPGQELFRYLGDDGGPRTVGSREVNEYLQEVTGGPFTAKDFRTWGASVSVAARLTAELQAEGLPGSATDAHRRVVAAIKVAAERLANTPAVCRASYVHPAVLDGYPDLLQAVDERAVRLVAARHRGLDHDEARLLALLEAAEPTDLEATLASGDPGS